MTSERIKGIISLRERSIEMSFTPKPHEILHGLQDTQFNVFDLGHFLTFMLFPLSNIIIFILGLFFKSSKAVNIPAGPHPIIIVS